MQGHPSPEHDRRAESPPRPWLDFVPQLNSYPFVGPSRSPWYPWAVESDRRRRWRARVVEAVSRRISQRPWAAMGRHRRPDPWLTPYACRLPNGEMGRAAAALVDGEWTLVCRSAA